MASGIYTIHNKINKKLYVGYATDMRKRMSYHKARLNKGLHRNSRLQKDYIKYGAEAFEFEILEECEPRFLASVEHYWATTLDVHKLGYNVRNTHPDGKYSPKEESISKLRGKKRNLKQRVRISKNPRIIQIFSLKGELIRECFLISQASELTGVKQAAIKNNLYGLSKVTKKFIFKHKEVSIG